jgi:hypothetical protein
MGVRRNATGCGKVAHKSAALAEVQAKKTKKADVRPYKCPDCGMFHVGHSRDGNHVQKRIDQLLGIEAERKRANKINEELLRCRRQLKDALSQLEKLKQCSPPHTVEGDK